MRGYADEQMLEHVQKLVKNGFAVHLLKPKSKAPMLPEWSIVPKLTYKQLVQQYKAGMNLGVRTGKWSKIMDRWYLHIMDLDIRNADLVDEAREELESYLPDYAEYPCVLSGSGGESRHYYFLSPKPLRSTKLAHSDTFEMVYSKALKREVKKWDWEISLLGTGAQAVIPPSIHDVSDKPYIWLVPFDFIDLAIGDGPIIDDDTAALLGADGDDGDFDKDDPRYQPLGLDLDDIEEVLRKLPVDDWIEDREGWYRMGMAIHHETGGSKEGFDLWNKYSKRSKKFDIKNSKGRWKSFKNRRRPFRMASLQSVARDVDLDAALDDDIFENLDDDMDLESTKPKKSLADELLGELDSEIEFEDLSEIPDIDDDYVGTKRDQKIKKAKVESELGKKVPAKIARMNKTHFVVRIKSKTLVGIEYDDGSVEFASPTEVNNWYENDRVSTEKSTIPLSKAWLQHPQRRQFSQGVVFDPKNKNPNVYNLWRGWSVDEGDPKDCPLFLKHCKEIICRGDETCFRYLMGWLAHMVQFPEDKPGVAVAIRGRKGAGKDTIAVYFSKILKHHCMMISQKEHLIGRFNDHQKNLMFLHVEEGYWAGSKQDEGPLKSIITSPTVTIEPKGVNAFQINSVMRILMTSNEDWIVPASGPDERRYFVVDADDAYCRSGRLGKDAKVRKAYFDALRDERENGGPQALLAYLKDYDLTEFDVRDPPQTAALDEQKLAGLKNVDRWWADQLMDGELEFNTLQLSASRYQDWQSESVQAESEQIFEEYEQWFDKQRHQGERCSKEKLFLRLKQLTDDGMGKDRRVVNGKRTYITQIPALRECRKAFDKFEGTKLDWKRYGMSEGPPLKLNVSDDEI